MAGWLIACRSCVCWSPRGRGSCTWFSYVIRLLLVWCTTCSCSYWCSFPLMPLSWPL